jgi:hypothetical protein
MDSIAEGYVKLVLNVGLYDSDYVDAYYGPEDWLPSNVEKQDTFPYHYLKTKVIKLIKSIGEIDRDKLIGLEKQRHKSLVKQLKSVQAKIEILNGKQYSFDEELELLYDAVAPIYNEGYYQEMISKLENLVPGTGNLSERLNSYLEEFVIPHERLDTVFSVAIAECRKRTLAHIELPENEKFIFEYVTDKTWRLYNWYKGNSFSVIQINTDLPIPIYRAILGGAHEGYPGHHVYSTIVEKYLVKEKGWKEYSILPLFIPRMIIIEGLAIFAQELVMPLNERISFEREVLFPLAGLDIDKIEKYYQIRKIQLELDYAVYEVARNYLDGKFTEEEAVSWLMKYGLLSVYEVARNYLDGKFTEEEAVSWLMKYGLLSPELAYKKLNFIRQYRSYVMNYILGYNIVKNYIESNGGTSDNIEMRWKLYINLLTSPLTPSDLINATKEEIIKD